MKSPDGPFVFTIVEASDISFDQRQMRRGLLVMSHRVNWSSY